MPFNFQIDVQSIVVEALLRIVGAIVVLVAGRWIAKFTQRLIHRVLQRMHGTPSVVEILSRIAYFSVVFFAFCVALVILGVPAGNLITVLAVILIVGAVALRESLRDIAATVIFIIFQPFKPGDQIETNGIVGTVEEILLFSTVLITLDNRKLITPNGNIQNSNLFNYTAQEYLTLNLPVTLGYGDDLEQAERALLDIAHADKRVLTEPAPFVDLMDLVGDGLGLVLRVFTKPENYWALRPLLNANIKQEFDRQHLTIPVRQMQLELKTPLEQQVKPVIKS